LPDILEDAQSGVSKFVEFSALATEAAEGIYDAVGSGRRAMKDAEITMSSLKTASQDIEEMTPKIGRLVESADAGVNETRRVLDAVKRSWLIRGYFEPAGEGEPLVLSGRDIAGPEVPR
jgi:hypothetical protein